MARRFSGELCARFNTFALLLHLIYASLFAKGPLAPFDIKPTYITAPGVFGEEMYPISMASHKTMKVANLQSIIKKFIPYQFIVTMSENLNNWIRSKTLGFSMFHDFSIVHNLVKFMIDF